MNRSASGGEHSGSSRGHAYLTVTVTRVVDAASGKTVTTKFNVIDLAGAERPSKTGEKRLSGPEVHERVMTALITGRPIEQEVAVSAFCINYELSAIGLNVITATSANRAGNPYKCPAACATHAMRMVSGSFGGSCALAMIVTLSQAPQCGWETWFSCRYGDKLAQLRYVPIPQKPITAEAAVKAATEEVAAQRLALAGGTRAAAMKPSIATRRRALLLQAEQDLAILRELAGQAPGLVQVPAAAP